MRDFSTPEPLMKPNRRRSSPSRMDRRVFLKGVVAGGAAAILVPRALRAAAPQPGAAKRVNLACIGIGGRGADDVKGLQDTGLANIVALCDTEIGAQTTRASPHAHP